MHTQEYPLAAHDAKFTLATEWPGSGGTVGTEFKPRVDGKITSVGFRIVGSGPAYTQVVDIWDTETDALLAHQEVTIPAFSPSMTWVYVELAKPLKVFAGVVYVVSFLVLGTS